MQWILVTGLLYFAWLGYNALRVLQRIGNELYLIRKGEKEPEDDDG